MRDPPEASAGLGEAHYGERDSGGGPVWRRITGVCVRAILGMDWWGKGDREVLRVCAEVNQGSCVVGSGCSSPATAGGAAANGALAPRAAYGF
jgi:hypothetical protein